MKRWQAITLGVVLVIILRILIHESGHAIIALLVGMQITDYGIGIDGVLPYFYVYTDGVYWSVDEAVFADSLLEVAGYVAATLAGLILCLSGRFNFYGRVMSFINLAGIIRDATGFLITNSDAQDMMVKGYTGSLIITTLCAVLCLILLTGIVNKNKIRSFLVNAS